MCIDLYFLQESSSLVAQQAELRQVLDETRNVVTRAQKGGSQILTLMSDPNTGKVIFFTPKKSASSCAEMSPVLKLRLDSRPVRSGTGF